MERGNSKNFTHHLETIFEKYLARIDDEFHAHVFKQLKSLITECFELYERKQDPKTFKSFRSLFVEPISVASQNALLKHDLKHLALVDFGTNVQEKIKAVNPDALPLEQVNVMKLKKIFLAHPDECPSCIASRFNLFQLKNYVNQRKHSILRKKTKLLIDIPVVIQIPVSKNDSTKIVGVDWGIRNLLSASIFDFEKKAFLTDIQLDKPELWGKIMASRGNFTRLQRIKAHRERGYLKKGRFFKKYSSSLTMHGLKNALRLMQIAHVVSASLVAWGITNDSRVIAVESLKSLRPEKGKLSRELNFRVSHSPRSLVKRLLDMKIKRFGGKLYAVNAGYTSQYSSELILEALKSDGRHETWNADTTRGYRTNDPSVIPPPNEKGGEFFVHDMAALINADTNASRNIALKLFHHFK
ncbi:MAG: hypothetical protein JRJ62_08370 [Deltaproteobacteria bacterium]|nr:hypothetical protein [Deltaproteobacteria bacterium]